MFGQHWPSPDTITHIYLDLQHGHISHFNFRGWYTILKTLEQNRICPMYNSNCVENEIHFVMKCTKYDMLRYTLFTKAR